MSCACLISQPSGWLLVLSQASASLILYAFWAHYFRPWPSLECLAQDFGLTQLRLNVQCRHTNYYKIISACHIQGLYMVSRALPRLSRIYSLGMMSVLDNVLGVCNRLVCNVQGVQCTLQVHPPDVQWDGRCTMYFESVQWSPVLT